MGRICIAPQAADAMKQDIETNGTPVMKRLTARYNMSTLIGLSAEWFSKQSENVTRDDVFKVAETLESLKTVGIKGTVKYNGVEVSLKNLDLVYEDLADGIDEYLEQDIMAALLAQTSESFMQSLVEDTDNRQAWKAITDYLERNYSSSVTEVKQAEVKQAPPKGNAFVAPEGGSVSSAPAVKEDESSHYTPTVMKIANMDNRITQVPVALGNVNLTKVIALLEPMYIMESSLQNLWGTSPMMKALKQAVESVHPELADKVTNAEYEKLLSPRVEKIVRHAVDNKSLASLGLSGISDILPSGDLTKASVEQNPDVAYMHEDAGDTYSKKVCPTEETAGIPATTGKSDDLNANNDGVYYPNTFGIPTLKRRYAVDPFGKSVRVEKETPWEDTNEDLQEFQNLVMQSIQRVKDSGLAALSLPAELGKVNKLPTRFLAALADALNTELGVDYRLVTYKNDGKYEPGRKMLQLYTEEVNMADSMSTQDRARDIQKKKKGWQNNAYGNVANMLDARTKYIIAIPIYADRKAAERVYAAWFNYIVQSYIEKNKEILDAKYAEAVQKGDTAKAQSILKSMQGMDANAAMKALGEKKIHAMVYDIMTKKLLTLPAAEQSYLITAPYDIKPGVTIDDYISQKLEDNGGNPNPNISSLEIQNVLAMYGTVAPHLDAVALDASKILKDTYGLKTNVLTGSSDISNSKATNDDMWDELYSDKSTVVDEELLNSEEESVEYAKESAYDRNKTLHSVFESMTAKVKSALSGIYETDPAGNPMRDAMGLYRMHDIKYVHKILVSAMSPCLTMSEMLQQCEEMSDMYPFLKQVKERLDNDSDGVLKTQFFNTYRTNYVRFFVHGKTDPIRVTLVSRAGKQSKVNSIVQEWSNMFIQGMRVSDKPIVDINGNIHNSKYTTSSGIVDNRVGEALTRVKELYTRFFTKPGDTKQQSSREDMLYQLRNTGFTKELHEVLQQLDVDVDVMRLQNILLESVDVAVENVNFGAQDAQRYDNACAKILKSLEFLLTRMEDKIVPDNDMFNPFDTYARSFGNIADALHLKSEMNYETSTTENGKTHYPNIQPSALGNLIKKMTRMRGRTKEQNEEWMLQEFGQDSWFFDQKSMEDYMATRHNSSPSNVVWHIEILQKYWDTYVMQFPYSTVEDESLDHAVVLHKGGSETENWGESEDLEVMFDQYQSGTSDKQMAYYAFPTMSDAATAEFVALERNQYIGWGFMLNQAELAQHVSQAASKGAESFRRQINTIVMQELSRILRLHARARAIQKGKITEAQDFDIEFDSEGNITKRNGAQFKFFPILNNMRLTVGGKETSVIEAIEEAVKKSTKTKGFDIDMKSMSEIKAFLSNAMFRQEYGTSAMEIMYNSFVEECDSNGFLMKHSSFNRHRLAGETMEKKEKYKAWAEAAGWTSNHNLFKALAEFEEVYNEDNNDFSLKRAKTAFKLLLELENLSDTLAGMGLTSEGSTVMQELNLHITTLANSITTVRTLADFYFNSIVARNTMIQMTSTDIGYFGSAESFYKRNKQQHSCGIGLNTEAEFIYTDPVTGKADVVRPKKYEDTLTITDQEIFSSMREFIIKAAETAHGKGIMSKATLDFITTTYSKEVNVTDGQGFRTLPSYRDVNIMKGTWTAEHERAFRAISATGKDASFDYTKNFDIMWQAIKPFMYAQLNVPDGLGGYLRKPIQHKNSEIALLAAYKVFSTMPGIPKSEKLEALDKALRDNSIDVVQFVSVSKVAPDAVLDLSEKAVDRYIEENSKEGKPAVTRHAAIQAIVKGAAGRNAKGDASSKFIRSIPYEYYVEQVKNPPHFMDSDIKIGTQYSKLITADMPSRDAEGKLLRYSSPNVMRMIDKLKDSDFIAGIVNEDGSPVTAGEIRKEGGFTAEQLKKLYTDIRIQNVKYMMKDLQRLFGSNERLSKKLLATLEKSSRFDLNLASIFTLKDGEFQYNFADPSVLSTVENVLTTLIKKSTVLQTGKGAALIQVSAYGYTESLGLIFKDKSGKEFSFSEWYDKNKKSYKSSAEAYKGYQEWCKKALKNKEITIAAFECYMPVTSQSMIAPLIDKETGYITIENLPHDMREALGYRIPTEGKLSMAPLRIKGFTNALNGSVVMLPSEITTIAGSDFDIDKLYTMLREFTTVSRIRDVKKAWDAFYKDNPELVARIEKSKLDNFRMALEIALAERPDFDITREGVEEQLFENYVSQHKNWEFVPEAKDMFQEWIKKHPEHTEEVIRGINYDFAKTPSKNTRQARHNMMIDLSTAVLTSEGCSGQVLTPQGFDNQKKAAFMCRLRNALSTEELTELLDDSFGKSDKILLERLRELTVKQLKSLIDKASSGESVLSLVSQMRSKRRNMAGKGLIGAYANHSVNHAVTQEIGMSVPRAVTINGRTTNKISEMMVNKGTEENPQWVLVSQEISGYQGASVDNAKEPVLSDLQQSFFTVNATMALIRMGYTSEEVGFLLNQPAIKDLLKFAELTGSRRTVEFTEQQIMEYASDYGIYLNPEMDNLLDTEFTSEQWFADMKGLGEITAEKPDNMPDDVYTKSVHEAEKAYHTRQVAAMQLFLYMARIGEDLKALSILSKTDTQKSGCGPDFGTVMTTIAKVDRFFEDHRKGLTYVRSPYFDNFPWKELSKIDMNNIDEVLDKVKDNPMAYNYAIYLCSMGAMNQLFEGRVPHFTTNFRLLFNMLTESSARREVTPQLANKMFKEAITYKLTQLDFFSSAVRLDNGKELKKKIVVTKDKKTGLEVSRRLSNSVRNYFVMEYPALLSQYKKEHPDHGKYRLLQDIVFMKPNSAPVAILSLNNTGRLDDKQRDRYTADWELMYKSGNPAEKQIALDLVKYCIFKNGFAFGPNSFAHLIPQCIKDDIPGFQAALNELNIEGDPNIIRDFEHFLDQFFLNHIDTADSWQLAGRASYKNLAKTFKKTVSYKNKYTGKTGTKKIFADKVVVPIDSVSKETGLCREDKEGRRYYRYVMFMYNGQEDPITGESPLYKFFYKLEANDGINLHYRLVQPLGNDVHFKEYEYNTSADMIERSIDMKKVRELAKKRAEDKKKKLEKKLSGDPVIDKDNTYYDWTGYEHMLEDDDAFKESNPDLYRKPEKVRAAWMKNNLGVELPKNAKYKKKSTAKGSKTRKYGRASSKRKGYNISWFKALAKYSAPIVEAIVQSVMANNNPGMKVVNSSSYWTREDVKNDTGSLYIFTDNLDRSSGDQKIQETSEYYKNYGSNSVPLYYPKMTSAVVRGLPNAMPVSTMKGYQGVNGKSYEDNKWSDADIEDFKKAVDEEFERIYAKWNTGNYRRIVLPKGGFFGSHIAQIDAESEVGQYLAQKIAALTAFVSNENPAMVTDSEIADAVRTGAGEQLDTEEEFTETEENDTEDDFRDDNGDPLCLDLPF